MQRFDFASFAGGTELRSCCERPNLTVSDARALEEQATTLQYVDLELGAGIGQRTMRRVFYRDLKTKNILVFGSSEFFAEGTRIPILPAGSSMAPNYSIAGNVAVLGNTAHKLLF